MNGARLPAAVPKRRLRLRRVHAGERHGWTLSDGTVLLLGGTVLGSSPVAAELRRRLEVLEDEWAPVLPCPDDDHDTPLDPRNPALLDLWIRDALSPHGLLVVASTYRYRFADLPPAAQAKVRAWRKWAPLPPGHVA